MTLRDAETTLAHALAETLAALELTDKDRAAIQLAKHYAALIDASADMGADRAWALRWIGPLYHAALSDLGGTPAARAAMKQPAAAAPGARTQLDMLREARARVTPDRGR